MYSLGSPKTLTQFLYQRLGLPFFCDVGEQLSGKKQTRHLNNDLKIAKLSNFLINSEPIQSCTAETRPDRWAVELTS